MPVGKPRNRWINAVEIDSKEILKVRNWKRESQDRQVWRRHLKEAKTRLRAVAPQKKKKKKKKTATLWVAFNLTHRKAIRFLKLVLITALRLQFMSNARN
jgi:hypothetical protein